MKKILPSLILAFILIPFSTQADRDGFFIDSYNTSVLVDQDSSLNVQEEIIVNFTEYRHGIYRKIPTIYKDRFGNRSKLVIDKVKVFDKQGDLRIFSIENIQGYLQLKIGDPDKEVIGVQTYAIEYRAKNAIRFFDDFDEIYWNAIGTEWNTFINSASSKVVFHKGLDLASRDLYCYTGEREATSQNCEIVKNGNKEVFAEAFGKLQAREGLTLSVKLPKNFLTQPSSLERASLFLSVNWGYFIPFLALLIAFLLWREHGKDIDLKKPVVVQFDSPLGLSPGQVAFIKDESYSAKAFSADIIGLAVKGYVKIKEGEPSKLVRYGWVAQLILFGVLFLITSSFLVGFFINPRHQFSGFWFLPGMFMILFLVSVSLVYNFKKYFNKNGVLKGSVSPSFYVVQRTNKEVDNQLNKFENFLLNKLFENISEFEIAKNHQDVRLQKIYSKVSSQVSRDMINKNFFEKKSMHFKTGYIVFGFVLTFGAFFTVGMAGRLDLLLGQILSGVIILIFGIYMSKKTPKGVETFHHIKGLRMYIDTAERYRVKFQEKEHLFEDYLPYAMVFGLAEKWISYFNPVHLKTSWYVANAGSSVNFNSFNNFSSGFTSAVRSSSNSGSSGGGSSGGGSGGGGGGSW